MNIKIRPFGLLVAGIALFIPNMPYASGLFAMAALILSVELSFGKRP